MVLIKIINKMAAPLKLLTLLLEFLNCYKNFVFTTCTEK